MGYNISRVKYPLFFLGAVLMTLPAIIYKFHSFDVSIVDYSVLVGFLLFAFSIVSGITAFRNH